MRPQYGQAMLAVRIRHEIEAVAPLIRTRYVHRWLEGYESTRQSSGFIATLFTAFGVFGLMLCAVGLYGVLAYTVSRRTGEIGLRMALGARPRDVLRLVLTRGLALTLGGIGLGLLAAAALSRGLTTLLFEVGPGDPLAFAGIAVLLSLVALAACALPARRAAAVEPLVALHEE